MYLSSDEIIRNPEMMGICKKELFAILYNEANSTTIAQSLLNEIEKGNIHGKAFEILRERVIFSYHLTSLPTVTSILLEEGTTVNREACGCLLGTILATKGIDPNYVESAIAILRKAAVEHEPNISDEMLLLEHLVWKVTLGDTVEKNPILAIIKAWLEEWLEEYQMCELYSTIEH